MSWISVDVGRWSQCPNPVNAPEEEKDDDRGSSRVVAPLKPNRPTTPSRILRRAPIPEASALPMLRARKCIGWRNLGAAELWFMCKHFLVLSLTTG
jgi:hypothetical protein